MGIVGGKYAWDNENDQKYWGGENNPHKEHYWQL
jgi:hypothetical protein